MKGNLPITIDFRSGIPIYMQIMEQITRMLAANQLKPGDQLPTVRQLAADLRVNFNTVARAYKLLDEAGTISTQHGRGTYILEPANGEHKPRLPLEDLETLTRQYLADAQQMGFTPAEIKQALDDCMQARLNEPLLHETNRKLEEK